MAWAIRTIYTSRCVQMDPQQLPKTSKFYSICNKCDMQKTAGGEYHPSGNLKVINANDPTCVPRHGLLHAMADLVFSISHNGLMALILRCRPTLRILACNFMSLVCIYLNINYIIIAVILTKLGVIHL